MRVLPVGKSGKRLERRGVDAIFTPDQEQRNARFVVGLAGVLVGIFLWAIVTLDIAYPKLFGTSEFISYLSIVLVSLGLIFVISGAGICISYSIFESVHGNSRITEKVDPSANNTIALDRGPASQGYGRSSAGILSSKGVKLGMIALLQSCITSFLYAGLVDEYQSNNSMQQWVSSLFPYGQQILSWEAVLVVSALYGIIVVQFLQGWALAK